MDQQRRRLTVSACDPNVKAVQQSPGAGKIDEQVRKFFGKFSKDSCCVFVRSKTDVEQQRKRSFADKRQEVLVEGADMTNEQAVAWLGERGVCFRCKKGQKPESPNQDSFAVLYVENNLALYGVLDGHGPLGHDASDMGQEFLIGRFLEESEAGAKADQAFKTSFLATQDFLEKESGVDCSTSGATCTMVYHDFKEKSIMVAHVGDSRSVLLNGDGKAIDLTVDHKPNLPEEKKRIENAKPPGRVIFDGYFNYRVFAKNGQYPGLNMSRALGDVVGHKEAGISAEPDTRKESVPDTRKSTLLVCSDGVWEFVQSQQAADMVKVPDPSGASIEKLTKASWDAWMEDSDGEISDDITAVVVHLAQASASR